MKMRRLANSLYFQVIVGILLGVALGYFSPGLAEQMKPLGDGFIKLIKMLIAPIIFCTVVLGIAQMDTMRKLGRIGGKALIYFEVLTSLALCIGLVVVRVVKPGAGMNVDPGQLDASSVGAFAKQAQHQSVPEFFLRMIPDTFAGAFAEGNILQVLLVAILCGVALALLGPKTAKLVALIEQASLLFFKVINMLMRLAPLGAFGAISFTIGKYGLGALGSLGWLMACFYTTCLLFIFVVLNLIAHLAGFSLLKLLRYLADELFLVLGTSSSESALPTLMAKLERIGASKEVVGIVVPTGYSFNLDGSSIYFTMAAIFIAQALNLNLSLRDELGLLAVLLLTSKGAAGVTGSGFVTLAATLSAVHTIPLAGMALILGIDRFMSEARSLTNLIGNAVATLVVARWENALDEEQLHRELGESAQECACARPRSEPPT
jgi:aerobic C4-dicarboxylate transport protein